MFRASAIVYIPHDVAHHSLIIRYCRRWLCCHSICLNCYHLYWWRLRCSPLRSPHQLLSSSSLCSHRWHNYYYCYLWYYCCWCYFGDFGTDARYSRWLFLWHFRPATSRRSCDSDALAAVAVVLAEQTRVADAPALADQTPPSLVAWLLWTFVNCYSAGR